LTPRELSGRVSFSENFKRKTESRTRFGVRFRSRDENFYVRMNARRESLGTDSLDFDRFRSSTSAREAICAKYFCTAFAMRMIALLPKFTTGLREKILRVAFAPIYHRRKKTLCHRAFCNVRITRV
jgi:hypothetical protein